jgi:MFS transporter, DHA2 family, methylenomycin A resistance protein
MVPVGVGGSFTVPPVTSLLLDAVPSDAAGTASGVLNTVRQMGGSLGVAVFGAVLATAPAFQRGLRIDLLGTPPGYPGRRLPRSPGAQGPPPEAVQYVY